MNKPQKILLKLQYDQSNHQVRLQYNDYNNQNQGELAPKAIKNLDPLVAMLLNNDKIKTQRVNENYTELAKDNDQTIRTIFQIIKALLNLEEVEEIKCIQCGSSEITIQEMLAYTINIKSNANFDG